MIALNMATPFLNSLLPVELQWNGMIVSHECYDFGYTSLVGKFGVI